MSARVSVMTPAAAVYPAIPSIRAARVWATALETGSDAAGGIDTLGAVGRWPAVATWKAMRTTASGSTSTWATAIPPQLANGRYSWSITRNLTRGFRP